MKVRIAKRVSGATNSTVFMKQAGALLCLLLGLRDTAEGAVYQAASMNNSDVAAAVAQATNGDTVLIPPGVAQWTNTLIVSNGITLMFAGIGQSIVQDYIACPPGNNPPPWSQGVIAFFTQSNISYRLSGLEIDAGVVRTNIFVNGAIHIQGSTAAFRVDHCGFFQIYNTAVYPFNSACGVIDHCTFNMEGNPHAIAVFHDSWANQTYGDGSWETPVGWGTSNAVYIEDCLFTNGTTAAWGAVDSFAGARLVFRHNTVINGFIGNHGTESTGLDRSGRSMEIYYNTFIDSNKYVNAVSFRGGTGVVWSNNATGYNMFGKLACYRCTDYYSDWGCANGTNLLDTNATSIPLLTVTHTGPNNSTALIVSNANWAVNQWVGYSVIDTNTAGVTNFGMICSNNATTAYLVVPQAHSDTMFNNGDTVQFYEVIQPLDMPGTSTCGNLTRNSNTSLALPPWPSQAIEPVYTWGDTLNGNAAGLSAGTPVVTQGIYLDNNIVKPGYIPFVYPHPLVSGVFPPLPPSNLKVAASN